MLSKHQTASQTLVRHSQPRKRSSSCRRVHMSPWSCRTWSTECAGGQGTMLHNPTSLQQTPTATAGPHHSNKRWSSDPSCRPEHDGTPKGPGKTSTAHGCPKGEAVDGPTLPTDTWTNPCMDSTQREKREEGSEERHDERAERVLFWPRQIGDLKTHL